ncbi:sensor histidine kinase [Portibacter marinus]|uniref:sensor histidine kinase n=1 Tax=Portibacter marinus TaxID=2898660 RepID=UPI001F2E4824|nr:ATP-binding protein [Portibacter marinus]
MSLELSNIFEKSRFSLMDVDELKHDRLHSMPDDIFEDIFDLLNASLHPSVLAITLYDLDTQWIYGNLQGNTSLDLPIKTFCAEVIESNKEGVLTSLSGSELKDTSESLYALRFNGILLIDHEGFVIGVLTIVDSDENSLRSEDTKLIVKVAKIIERRFTIYSANSELEFSKIELKDSLLQLEQSSKKLEESNLQIKATLRKNNALIRNLASRNRELDQFSYIVSHDLKEPIRTVTEMVKILKEEQGDHDRETAEIFNFIIDATSRMNALIEHLLDYAKLGKSGSYELINMHELLAQVLQDLNTAINEKKATITFGKLSSVRGNKIEIKQLLQNLVSNCIKFSKKNVPPRIHIEQKEEKEWWVVSIRDNGIGIEDDQKENIFNMFSRSHMDYEGHGIGLAYCKKIVEHHNGEIFVADNPSGGSIFTFRIDKEL